MFCAFDGPPKIVRLHGAAAASSSRATPASSRSSPRSPPHPRSSRRVRSIVTVDVTRVGDSCGYQVPVMRYEHERDQLLRFADNRIRKEGRGRGAAATARSTTPTSLDGLVGLDPLV